MEEPESKEPSPERSRRQPADEMLAQARQSIYELPDTAALADVSALGDSIVDALTTEFGIEEIPAPGYERRAEAAKAGFGSESGGRGAASGHADAASADGDIASGGTLDAVATMAMPAVGAAGAAARAAARPAHARDEAEGGAGEGPSREEGGIADGVSPDETAQMEPLPSDFDDFDDADDDFDDAEDIHGEDGAQGRFRRRERRRIPVRKIVAAVCILLVVAIVGTGAYFVWDRWYRFDDAADIQGEWQTTNAQRTLVIDATHLKIAPDVAYDYELDTKAKTITYTFGNSSGVATYRFSADRQVLVIEENGEVDWMMALHLKDDPVLSGSEVPEGTSKLVRLSDDIMAEPRSLDDTSDGTEAYHEPFLIGGYTEYTQTERPATTSKKDSDDEKDDDKDKADSDGKDDGEDDSEALEPGQDPDADYFDSERALNFYFDDSQQLYYDQYGNYYYDMYGTNPYELPLAEEDSYAEGSYDDSAYYEEVYY